MISIRDLYYRYRGSSQPALEDLNLKIERGEFVLLTGPSGCGKSTLALALSGFLFTQFDGEFSGEVEVGGYSVPEQPLYHISDLVGLVQQNPEAQFCTLQVEDEIVFGMENRRWGREKMEEMLTWSLEAVGADHLRHRSLQSLSGGEKQKVALASILAARPEVIIFDEPTSHLDPTATREIFEVILDLQRNSGLTILVIEHKLDFLSRAEPRRIQMRNGRIDPHPPENWSAPGMDFWRDIPVQKEQPPVLEARQLELGYQRQVLQKLNFHIQPGDCISLMGDNGSGKSTLLLSLCGLIPPLEGEIFLKGQPLQKIHPAQVGREVGLVFQNPDHQLFARSVWEEAVFAPENMGLAPEDYRDHVQELLDWAGLGDRLEDHPYRLSFGEKRRLNLISLLAYQPTLLLLDEIFVGQDRENALYLLELLQDFREQGGAVVMVNHNPAYYPLIANRIWFLDQGRMPIDASLRQGMEELAAAQRQSYLPEVLV